MDRWTDRLVLVNEASSEIGKCIIVELSKYPLKIVALTSRIALTQVFIAPYYNAIVIDYMI